MRVKHLAAGLIAFAALSLATPARADDLIRLNMPGDVSAGTFDLKARPADLAAEVLPTWFRHRGWGGGYYGGGFRYSAGFSYGYGYRGFYGGGFSPRYYGAYYGGGFSPRYYGAYYGGGYYPRYYGAYYPGVYYGGYAPSYAYYGSYYYPCSVLPAQVVTGSAIPAMPRIIDNPMPAPMPGASPAPGTFDYNGGPMAPVPMPRAGEESVAKPAAPRKPMIVNELFVSETKPATGKWVYPAYGEAAKRQR